VPSMPLRTAKRTFTILPRLPQMRAALKRLIREVRELQKRLGVQGEKPEGPREETEDF